jgi:flagellar assembly protein FliH
MALIKRANSTTAAREAVVLDLGDLMRQAEAIIAAARRQAATIVAEAHTTRERLIADAAAVGKAEGLAEGLAEGHRQGAVQGQESAVAEHRATLVALQAGWASGLDQFLSSRERLLAEAQRDVLKLALAIGEKVTKRAIAAQPEVAAAQLEAVLALVLRPTRVVVRIHPLDKPLVETALPALVQRFSAVQHVELVEDAALARGSCVAALGEGGGGEVDASIPTQLDRIAEALVPGGDHAASAGAVQ